MAKERPILFSSEMVSAILHGNKTMTRRVIFKDDPADHNPWKSSDGWQDGDLALRCPYVIGDLLWVREAWRVGAWNYDSICVDYQADGHCRKEWLKVPDEEQFERLWVESTDDAIKAGLVPNEDGMYHWEPGQSPTRWRPSIFMPRWASRISLRIIEVQAEKLWSITEDDAIAEGITGPHDVGYQAFRVPGDSKPRYSAAKAAFADLWDAINAERGYSWSSNPWVWVIKFSISS